MDLFFLLCLISASQAMGNGGYQSLEMDRARSAWNFGGGAGGGGAVGLRSRQWMRPRSNLPGPGAIIANRRVGDNMRTNAWTLPSTALGRKSSYPSSSSAPIMRSRQSKPYQKPNRPKSKPMKLVKFNNRNSSSFQASSPYHQNHQKVQGNPRPTQMNRKPELPRTMSSLRHRGSRMIESRSDNMILNRFRKEDLWHLDKGEGYELKNEDLINDNLMRNPEIESNELGHFHEEHEDPEHEHEHEHDHDHLKQMEMNAEMMINKAEMNGEKFHQGAQGPHVHHHHHHNAKDETKDSKKKKEDPNKVIPVPLPRIHLPIPLGCLLAVPAFHPIRPRHHLTCLISIPGTPTMSKKRRKRSAEQQTTNQQQYPPQFFQMVDINPRMSPAMRKHFGNHVGAGKNPLAPSPVNLKVPATIIAPPQFDKADVLEMLLGSGGVNPKEMGTVLATNSRYVRFGRGLPSRGTSSVRGGRALNWFPDSSTNSVRNTNKYQQPLPTAPTPVNNPTQVQASSSPPPAPVQTQAQNPQAKPVQSPNPTITIVPSSVSPTPTISFSSQVKPTATSPLILNVQIAPRPPAQPSRAPPQAQASPVYQVSSPPSSPPSPPPPLPPQSPSLPYQVVSVSPAGKSKKNENFKYTQYWKPVSQDQSPIPSQSQPQKAYSYKYSDFEDNQETPEPTPYLEKVKPAATSSPSTKKKKSKTTSKYQENVDITSNTLDYSRYTSSSNPPSQSDYYDKLNSAISSSNQETQDLSSLLNYYNGQADDYYRNQNNGISSSSSSSSQNNLNNNRLQALYLQTQSQEQDEQDYYTQAYTYAVKKEPVSVDAYYIDSYPQTGAFQEYEMSTLTDDAGMSYSYQEDQDAEASRNYYLVKKLQAPDPIVINVPKDLSNEIK